MTYLFGMIIWCHFSLQNCVPVYFFPRVKSFQHRYFLWILWAVYEVIMIFKLQAWGQALHPVGNLPAGPSILYPGGLPTCHLAICIDKYVVMKNFKCSLKIQVKILLFYAEWKSSRYGKVGDLILLWYLNAGWKICWKTCWAF